MSYGNFSITIPVPGDTVGPTYAANVSDGLEAIQDVLDTKVTPVGMSIDDDLNFRVATNYAAALNIERVTLENKDAALNAATFPVALYVVSGNLYYNNNAGNAVQITNGDSVDVSASAGITGSGYGAADSGVEVNWDAANTKYRMRSGNGADDFASVELNNVLLNDGSSHTLTLAAPSMSANYTLTLPTAVPASTSLLTMASSGATATTRDPSVDTVTTSGNAIVGGTATIAGDTTVSTGDLIVTAGDVTATAGTTTVGALVAGSLSLNTTSTTVHAAAGLPADGSTAAYASGGAVEGAVTISGGSPNGIVFHIPTQGIAPVITAVTVYFRQLASGIATFEYGYMTGSGTTITQTWVDSDTTASTIWTALTLTTDSTVASNRGYHAYLQTTATSMQVSHIAVTFANA